MLGGASVPVQVGDLVAGKYRVERVLGIGGMGVVVAAMHVQLQQRVAIKFMLPQVLDRWGAVERFSREARAAAKLRSEHVARILDVDVLDTGSPYIVMEYLEGTDLADTLRRHGAVPASVAADYVMQALDVLAEAHALGIVHRDLKPDNLFVTRRADGSALVKVLDFGVSKDGPAAADTPLTRTQSIVGSPRYMSPEQMRSTREVDSRSDLWSLGIILYELVSGKPPFTAESFPELCLTVAMDPPPPLSAPQPLPDGFEAVVQRCLERDPELRFQSAAELVAALAPFAPPAAWPLVGRIQNLAGQRRLTPMSTAFPPAGDILPPPRRVLRSWVLGTVVAISAAIFLAALRVGQGPRGRDAPGANSSATRFPNRPRPPPRATPAIAAGPEATAAGLEATAAGPAATAAGPAATAAGLEATAAGLEATAAGPAATATPVPAAAAPLAPVSAARATPAAEEPPQRTAAPHRHRLPLRRAHRARKALSNPVPAVDPLADPE